MTSLQIGHFGLRTKDVDRAVEWYGRAFGADVRFRNEFAAFMSFDDEHHRFVIWDDGETEDRPAAAGGVDHIGFMCRDPGDLAEHYERLKNLGIEPTSAVNHHFTSSLYYRDPDGNEVEISCDNLPTKQAAADFMKSDAMAEAMVPPFFGAEFNPDELVRLRRSNAPTEQLARIGL
ncbi:VOC family protein [Sphingomonas sp.]|uniref:VOC family protein n=1 Tax=Sphingomonas sp. TaxID=28214 RepID=UPI0017B5AD09|nr:VOC family protein [Sphingomonas sp.]MBA3511371.1 VOC family protein [Sphingomonas sp.]